MSTADGLRIVRGAAAVASGAVTLQRPALVSRPVLVNGAPGVVAVDADGVPYSVASFTVVDGRIVEMHIVTDRDQLRGSVVSALGRFLSPTAQTGAVPERCSTQATQRLVVGNPPTTRWSAPSPSTGVPSTTCESARPSPARSFALAVMRGSSWLIRTMARSVTSGGGQAQGTAGHQIRQQDDVR
jgi:hypothetical protein